MTKETLQALRRLLMIEVPEAAEHIGDVSVRSWQYWETGKYTIPADVEQKMIELTKKRNKMVTQATKRPELYQYIKSYDAFISQFPDESVIDWRLAQSVAAELLATQIK